MKKVSRALARIYDAATTPAGVNNTQLAVLRNINRLPGQPLVRVAEALEMDRTSLYRAIAPLIRDGWLSSENGSDNRFRTAKLTKKGQRVLADANKLWSDLQNAVVQKFGRKEYDSLLKELRRLADCAAGAR